MAAHQAALRTRGDASARGRERLRLVKYLYGKGMDKEEVKLLFRLLAWLTKLPEDLEVKFNEELAEYEEEANTMTLETLLAPIELIALRKGREEGQQQGRAEAGQDWVRRLLQRRLGQVAPASLSRVQALPVETLLPPEAPPDHAPSVPPRRPRCEARTLRWSVPDTRHPRADPSR